MSKCKLDVDDRLHIRGNASIGFEAGLAKLQKEVAKNHKSSNFWHFSMKRFPQYTNKVWRWDFAPAGDHASTRLGWRLFAYVPDYNGPEPIIARAFICWDKKEEPKNNYIPFLAKILKDFLAERIEITTEENIFIDRMDGEGVTHSLCERCYYRMESSDQAELEIFKATHKQDCPGHPPSN